MDYVRARSARKCFWHLDFIKDVFAKCQFNWTIEIAEDTTLDLFGMWSAELILLFSLVSVLQICIWKIVVVVNVRI